MLRHQKSLKSKKNISSGITGTENQTTGRVVTFGLLNKKSSYCGTYSE